MAGPNVINGTLLNLLGHCASRFQFDYSSKVSRKAVQSLLMAGYEILVKEIALLFAAVWRKNHWALK